MGVGVNELLEEHASKPSRITTAGAVLRATQRGREPEQLVATERGLQDRVMTQAIMIVRVFIATAKRVYALRNLALHRVFDQIEVATVNHRTGRSARQTDLLVERFEKTYPPSEPRFGPSKSVTIRVLPIRPELNFSASRWVHFGIGG